MKGYEEYDELLKSKEKNEKEIKSSQSEDDQVRKKDEMNNLLTFCNIIGGDELEDKKEKG